MVTMLWQLLRPHLVSQISGALTKSLTGSDPIAVVALKGERTLVMPSDDPTLHSYLQSLASRYQRQQQNNSELGGSHSYVWVLLAY